MEVLFICTGNTCRSPMAEGILRYMTQEKNMDIIVRSAGIAAFDGDRAARNAIDAMKKIGIDISSHSSRQLYRELIEKSDLVLTMSKSHKDIILDNFPFAYGKVKTLLEYSYDFHKDIIDPYGGSLEIYEATRDEIYESIKKIIEGGKISN